MPRHEHLHDDHLLAFLFFLLVFTCEFTFLHSVVDRKPVVLHHHHIILFFLTVSHSHSVLIFFLFALGGGSL
jgi:hypothetical protein